MDITGQRPRGHHHSGSPDHESRDAEALRTSPSNCRRHVNTQSRQDCRDEKDSWSPAVTLKLPNETPLSSRISMPPLAMDFPSALQPQSLSTLSLVEQESGILDDLLLVFMGMEGQYIHFSNQYSTTDTKDRAEGPTFVIMSGLDPSLHELAVSMLQMATHHISLHIFVDMQSKDDLGSVSHAFCAALRRTLKEYLILIAQLEHQFLTNDQFSLHILHLHTRSTSRSLQQLHSITQEIHKRSVAADVIDDDLEDLDDVVTIIESLRDGRDARISGAERLCKGGAILDLITKRLSSMSGDPATRALLSSLVRDSSRPYMRMLNEWLHHGSIRDPYAEFLIKEQRSIRREGLEQDYTDEYWEKRYTIREHDIPPQLDSLKEKVLLAGKYLNVVRECGGVDLSKTEKNLPLTFEDLTFVENINSAYAQANSTLLTLLLTTHALPARLQSLKHYFFLDRSDFFSYFLELSTVELRKPAKSVNVGKLQSLLDIVLRQPGSVASEDPYKEDIKVQIDETSLTKWLMRVVNVTGVGTDAASLPAGDLLRPNALPTDDKEIHGFEALVFDYTVPFPISLVISRVTLTRYQLLFRYLLSLRHVETQLTGCWIEHHKTKLWRHQSANPRLECWKRKAFTLRARMLVYVQQLLYFCTSEVIEPNWQAMMSRLQQPRDNNTSSTTGTHKRTVDELMQDHVDFLATCLKECMLTNARLLKLNSKVMTTCTKFATFTTSLARYLAAADPDHVGTELAKTTTRGRAVSTASAVTAYDSEKLDKLFEMLHKYEEHFSSWLQTLLEALNYLAATETAVLLNLCARLSTASEGLAGNPIDFQPNGEHI